MRYALLIALGMIFGLAGAQRLTLLPTPDGFYGGTPYYVAHNWLDCGGHSARYLQLLRRLLGGWT